MYVPINTIYIILNDIRTIENNSTWKDDYD